MHVPRYSDHDPWSLTRAELTAISEDMGGRTKRRSCLVDAWELARPGLSEGEEHGEHVEIEIED
jgi:hypothetical protein